MLYDVLHGFGKSKNNKKNNDNDAETNTLSIPKIIDLKISFISKFIKN